MTENYIEDTAEWFEVSLDGKKPTPEQFTVQTGVHFEEVVEMIQALDSDDPETERLLKLSETALHALATHLKTQNTLVYAKDHTGLELLDALCDQIVTATGVGVFAGMHMPGALNEVNGSNWSKFLHGKALRNPAGKIMKGPHYIKAVLAPFL